MKKLIHATIAGFIFLCLTMGLWAQSSDNSLDQAELMKQFIGKWKAELGPDTISYWIITPTENGYIESGEDQVDGKTISTFHGIIGFSPNNERIINYSLLDEGRIIGFFGRFIAEDKYKVNIWNANHEVNFAREECTFLTPDKIKIKFQGRKWDADNWDEVREHEQIYERVK